MIYDVRTAEQEEISSIHFANKTYLATNIAFQITKGNGGKVKIEDSNEFVFVPDKQHALSLITALEKAIDLGWLK